MRRTSPNKRRPTAAWTIGIVASVIILPACPLPIPIGGATTTTSTTTPPPPPPPPPGACGNRANYFDGWLVNQGQSEGASAHITSQDAPLCTSDGSGNNFATAWSMIASGNGNGWAQTGPFKSAALNTNYHFAQQSPNGQTWNTTFGSQVGLGESHQYWQQSDRACGCIHSNVDSTRFMDSTFNPRAVWAQPFSPQFFGETTYSESDMPGTAGAPVMFTDMQTQDFNTDNWAQTGCATFGGRNDNQVRWSATSPDQSNPCNNFNLWHN